LSPVHEKEDAFNFSSPGDQQLNAPGSPVSETSGHAPHKRYVVKHDWSSIRAALWIAKHEHMSTVDECKGSDMRRQGPKRGGLLGEERPSTPSRPRSALADGERKGKGFESNAQASYFVNEESKKELRALAEDLAIVCPLVDGRMKDLAADR
jgi:5'-nucleotidase